MRWGSLALWMYRSPFSSAMRSALRRASSKSLPSSMISAPKPRIASTLSGLAPSWTQTVALTPNIFDARAMDWPWLPVEAVMTPFAFSSGLSWETRFMPPLILKAPVGCRFSCLT